MKRRHFGKALVTIFALFTGLYSAHAIMPHSMTREIKDETEIQTYRTQYLTAVKGFWQIPKEPEKYLWVKENGEIKECSISISQDKALADCFQVKPQWVGASNDTLEVDLTSYTFDLKIYFVHPKSSDFLISRSNYDSSIVYLVRRDERLSNLELK